MVNKVILWVLVALSFSFAEFYFAYDAPEGSDTVSIEVFNCDSDSVSFAMRKRELAKQFKTCAGKRSNYKVSVLFFTVAEGESGAEEEAECFKTYSDSLFLFARCGEAALSGKPLFSLDERLAYQYYFGIFRNVLQYIREYEKVNMAWEGKESLDKYNMDDEKNALAAMSVENMENAVAEAEGSREDKDMLLLFYKYLRAKYDWPYRCSIKPAFTCDTSWLGEQKAEFFKKYPEFAAKFDKVISIPVFTNDELITFARTYATENDCKIDDMAILALYTSIGNSQTEEEPVTISRVKDMIDKAISHATKGRRPRKGGKDKTIILRERDFDLS